MADPEHQEIFIIKRHSSHDDAHHGGAWKIAFADFMTAMMALFLVLWLISSTSEKTKHTVAQYFNPVKLVDMTTLKKGFRDPKETEMGSGLSVKESQEESDSSQHTPPVAAKKEVKEEVKEDAKEKGKEEVKCQAGPNTLAHAEAALFRDPYAVLAEIAESAPAQATKSSPGAARGAAPADAPGTFRDPFTTTPKEQEKPLEGLLLPAPVRVVQGKDDQGEDEQIKGANAHPAADAARPQEPAGKDVTSQALGPQSNLRVAEGSHAERSPETPRPEAAAAAKLKSDIVNAIDHGAHIPDLPHIEVQVTPEGILISLTDDAKYSMFAVGSAKPRPETVQIMEKIGQILKAGSGSIIIRGHTDGRPYRSAIYDNWRLSSARAHMALYMLARGGVSEKRFENVEGYADHHLKSPNNPNASENRRIEILLRKEKP